MMFYEILDLIFINLRDKKSITWNFSVCNWEDLLFLIAIQEFIWLLTVRKTARNRKTDEEMVEEVRKLCSCSK